ncbi:MAG: hypothetical protein RIG77_11595 [Cyclobacteriaceae bacterium]
MKLIHIINPVKVGENSDLFIAQPITFQSLIRAKGFCGSPQNIELLSAQFEEDQAIIPDFIDTTPDLTRSILEHGHVNTKKKLPFIKDILDRAYNNSREGDYIIYSNVDIALQPFFYEFVFKKIGVGLDAFVVNRRTISKSYSGVDNMNEMYSEIGKEHPGFDCFIFSREIYKEFVLGEAVLGANWIGRVLILNLIAFSQNFKLFNDRILTFHIGDDMAWKTPENLPLDLWNFNCLKNVIEVVKERDSIRSNALALKLIERTYELNKPKKVKKTSLISRAQKMVWKYFETQ